MRICAWLPPHILFFHFHTFFRREISAVLSVFLLFGGSLRVVSVRFVLCFLRCFFWVFVCCFLIPGLYGSLFGDSDLFCGIFLMLAKMVECQCESVQNEGVSSVMPGIFGVELKGSCSLRGDVSEPIVYLFTRFYEINTAFFRKKTLITLMRPDSRAARRCFAFGKTCCRSRFGAANLIL